MVIKRYDKFPNLLYVRVKLGVSKDVFIQFLHSTKIPVPNITIENQQLFIEITTKMLEAKKVDTIKQI